MKRVLTPTYSKFILCFFVILLLPISLKNYAFGQENSKEKDKIDLKYSIEAGYTVGGQIVKENFIFESGVTFQYLTDIKISSRIYYGLGLGIEKYDTETFIPVFLSFKGLIKKKKDAPYLSFQMGYSFAWDKGFNNYANYNYKGGLLFSTGFGRIFDIKEDYNIMIYVNFKHQFAKIDYETFDMNIYTENLNFDMISLRIGFMF